MNIIKKLYILTLLTSFVFSSLSMAMAEANNPNNGQFCLYATGGGYCLLYSLGSEFQTLGRRIGININVSSNFDPDGEKTPFIDSYLLLFPVFASYYLGGTNHRFYTDLGFVYNHYWHDDFSGNSIWGMAGIGYNYTPIEGGVYFKAGFALLYLEIMDSYSFLPWGSISIGYAF